MLCVQPCELMRSAKLPRIAQLALIVDRSLFIVVATAPPSVTGWNNSYISVLVDTYSAVVPDARGLPAAVVSTGVALVELEAVVLVPAHVEQRHSEGTLPCEDGQAGFLPFET